MTKLPRLLYGLILSIAIMLLSACCAEPLFPVYGNESLAYYVCEKCGRPIDETMVIEDEPLPVPEACYV